MVNVELFTKGFTNEDSYNNLCVAKSKIECIHILVNRPDKHVSGDETNYAENQIIKQLSNEVVELCHKSLLAAVGPEQYAKMVDYRGIRTHNLEFLRTINHKLGIDILSYNQVGQVISGITGDGTDYSNLRYHKQTFDNASALSAASIAAKAYANTINIKKFVDTHGNKS